MNADVISMVEHLSRSLFSVERLITGSAYLVGLLFMMKALSKLRKIADARTSGGSHEKMFVPIAYALGGAALIFLPSAVTILSNSAFGSGSSFWSYATVSPFNLDSAMKVLIQTAGLIWFFRGCVLLAHASEPGVQEGPKGLVFLIAGVLAMNFQSTMGMVNSMVNYLMDISSNTISISNS